MNFFGNHKTEEQKKNEATEQCKQWKRNLQKVCFEDENKMISFTPQEANKLDREIKSLERAEDKAAKECKKLAQSVYFNLIFSLF